jgi:hypothetical protein
MRSRERQGKAAQPETKKLPYGKERGDLLRKGPAVTNRLTNRSTAVIARVTAAEVKMSTNANDSFQRVDAH